MSSRRGVSTPTAKPLPTDRVLAGEHLTITRTACSAEGPFTARDLEALTGVSAHRCGLVMSFLGAYGLVEQAPGRGAYQPTRAGEAVAAAWKKSEEKGRQALRAAWAKSWFARCACTRLAQGPALRIGLVSKLMTLSDLDEKRSRHIEVLVDLMVAVGMLLPEDGGYLRWHENPSVPSPRRRADDQAADGDTSKVRVRTASESVLPAQRLESYDLAASTGDDLIALLSPPVLLADLGRLSREDMIALHGHIRGLAALLAKLRRHPMP
ncbi:hypothetical protein ACFY1U_28225 [Streptomyces sp. NPDC001351]|uniref:hypothetical protein n=1 Tax=Streptomyces sp. NPDC001351 TaxID=3364564 RepID=UPI0036B570DD